MERGVAGDRAQAARIKTRVNSLRPLLRCASALLSALYGQYFTVCTFRGGAWAGLKVGRSWKSES